MSRCVYSFDEISAAEFGFEEFSCFTYVLIIIIIIYLLEVFTSALAGLSLEIEWQQVSSSL